MLSFREVTASYGSLAAVRRLSLDFQAGSITAVFGHNGAGKTTMLRCAVGEHRQITGSVMLGDRVIRPGVVHGNVKLGLGFVPQGHNVFSDISVADNLSIAGMRHGTSSLEDVISLFPILGERSAQRAGSLSGGQQQMLAVGMALMAKPKVLLLDEPTTGLSPIMVDQLLSALRSAHDSAGTTIVMVEQNLGAALSIADRVVIMRSGELVLDQGVGEFDTRDLWNWF